MFDYTVQPGDTIYSVTRLFGITTAQLLAANPYLQDGAIAIGQTLGIPQVAPVRPVIEVNGYAPTTVDPGVLKNVLPYLTYLSILEYDVRTDGTLPPADDAWLVETARQHGVAPLMVVNINPNADPANGFSGELAPPLSDPELSKKLIDSIIATLEEKQYYGVNMNFTELYLGDYSALLTFLQDFTAQLHPLGYIMVAAPRIRTLIENQEAFVRGNAAVPLNSMVDRLILSTEWACTYEYREASYIDELQQAIDFMIQFVSSPKILLSIPGCCYDWRLGPEYAELYRLLSSAEADALAQRTGGVFRIDPRSRTSHFTYFGDDGMFHEVLCQIDTNLRAPLDLVEAYNLGGVSFRTIEEFSTASYQMVTAEFEIRNTSL
ncbi:MAG TPA: LysM peptidoglycan-binding domain-containing protein [Feifaniaceae bacterium]|nr:LysM peptidoglycan-binding domain-containing protein [Feifaniaceae bacterium]